MKFSIIIADKSVLAASDRKTWLEISKRLSEPNSSVADGLKEVIESIKAKFPELPNKMVWGNYLIFEEYSDFFSMEIDYADMESLKKEVLDIALPKGFVVLIGKENKIYRSV